jgi:hypothetical protein
VFDVRRRKCVISGQHEGAVNAPQPLSATAPYVYSTHWVVKESEGAKERASEALASESERAIEHGSLGKQRAKIRP